MGEPLQLQRSRSVGGSALGWGYDATEVPSVDDKAAECIAATGDDRVQCWAELDQQLMEEVVPWVPYPLQPGRPLVPQRHELLFDQSAGLAAFDQLAVVGSGNTTSG